MALTPDLNIQVPDLFSSEVQPTRTYSFDPATGEIGRAIDGLEAMKQFIIKAIRTIRFEHVIYPESYGTESDTVVGLATSAGFVASELPRVITEALIYDERISEVKDFDVEQQGDTATVSFTVVTNEGDLRLTEVVGSV
ncbi:DUF2634 domain-containing protein [Paenibacillus xylanexedens]|uniref:DUF2634 domain-containing protein n=1 Tax=Paenibacillus xylanexedens TaxID=528191 RepID=UPI001C8D71D4|nr:DUF2634 domain-containing protein [Paenibacillus xylanexedens]MBY0117845.1 DUF2634 domain-containing protein [Paenibacillus xylanexedens]